MSNFDALKAATVNPARALALDAGTIEAGKLADLIVVDGDPLVDPAALRNVVLVIQEGRVAIDRRDAATPRGSATAQQEAIAFCRRFLDDYSKGDFEAVARAFTPEAAVAIDDGGADGRSVPATQFLERAKAGRAKRGTLRETIVGVPIALVDGAIATVWASFRITMDAGPKAGGEAGPKAGGPGGEGTSGHGIDVLQLVRIGGEWKIAALSFTYRPDAHRPDAR
jgi:hypothetical protein